MIYNNILVSDLCEDDSRIIAYELFFYKSNEDILKKFGLAYDMYSSSNNSKRALLSLSMEIAFQHAELGHWIDTKK